MKKNQQNSNKHLWIIVGIIAVAMFLSRTNTQEPSGMIIQTPTQCPPDKTIDKTVVDSSTSGDWHDFHYQSGKDAAENAAEECNNYAATAGETDCDAYCGTGCEGSFTEDVNENGEITGYVTGNNGDYYSIGNTGGFGIPITKSIWENIINSGQKVAAECKVKGACHCAPKEDKQQQLQMQASPQIQQPREESIQPTQNQESYLSRLFKRVFGFFGIFSITPFLKSKKQ